MSANNNKKDIDELPETLAHIRKQQHARVVLVAFFAKDGKGTGFPYDPPVYLVTTGVYQYVSNPMQIGIVFLMAMWGMILSSALLSLTAPIALVLFIVFKNVCNGSCQIGKSDPNWQVYQRNTPKWIPFNFRTR